MHVCAHVCVCLVSTETKICSQPDIGDWQWTLGVYSLLACWSGLNRKLLVKLDWTHNSKSTSDLVQVL